MGLPPAGGTVRQTGWAEDARLKGSRIADGVVRLQLSAGDKTDAPRRDFVTKTGGKVSIAAADDLSRAIAGPAGVDIVIRVLQ
jgi:hypothetical protein